MALFTVTATKLDGTSAELTPVQESLKYTTAAVGGFGNCSFSLLGDRRRDVPKLATVRVYLDTQLAWEGRVEDHDLAPADNPATTAVSCYGLQRRLTDVSVRRIWSKRDLPINQPSPAMVAGLVAYDKDLAVTIGQYLPTDLSKSGIEIRGTGISIPNAAGNAGWIIAPAGFALTRLLGDLVLSGPNTGAGKFIGDVATFTSAGVLINGYAQTASTSLNIALDAGTGQVGLYMFNNSGGALTASATDVLQISNIRVLATVLQEDAAGGFYGGTILTDLIALIPGLTAGVIEAGSDYTIPAIERAIRDTSLSVVNEVAGYYNREWAVWENGSFNWTTPNRDEPQWIIPLEQLLPGSRIGTSIDTLSSQVYVLFVEALDANTSEQTAAAADARNPLVKAGITKDMIVQAPTVMTDNTASQLAALEAADQVYAPVTGTLVLNATSTINDAVGAARPAALIRAGTNAYLPGMPKTDSVLASPGRDGETLFHIVTTDFDMDAGTVTLELEGQGRQIDVITARLAASTRVVTG